MPTDDLQRVVQAVGGSVQSTCSDIKREHLGTCGYFEEKQIGGERYNLFTECPKAKTCTLILRGGAEQFIEEVERSLHDAIMVVKRAVKNGDVVAGGGAIEVREIDLTSERANLRQLQARFIGAYPETRTINPREATASHDRVREGTGGDSQTDLRQRRLGFDGHSEQASHEAR